MNTYDESDLDETLKITKRSRGGAGARTWVRGTICVHRFAALVFPEHAENPEWEITLPQQGLTKLSASADAGNREKRPHEVAIGTD